eukprot:TRINITY_DN3019_c0_g1_i1.p1 TRINITY_DN3019_c0_g1~~TRINITY_DN3019_c0_g1_i1.p1  ORF type:complete len:351 (-),score=102.82 TRINITY_DN3019_c0_g1_i1:39-1091(-)
MDSDININQQYWLCECYMLNTESKLSSDFELVEPKTILTVNSIDKRVEFKIIKKVFTDFPANIDFKNIFVNQLNNTILSIDDNKYSNKRIIKCIFENSESFNNFCDYLYNPNKENQIETNQKLNIDAESCEFYNLQNDNSKLKSFIKSITGKSVQSLSVVINQTNKHETVATKTTQPPINRLEIRNALSSNTLTASQTLQTQNSQQISKSDSILSKQRMQQMVVEQPNLTPLCAGDYQDAVNCILTIKDKKTPTAKAEILEKTINILLDCIRDHYQKKNIPTDKISLGADDLLPILCWILSRARINSFIIDLEFSSALINAFHHNGELGYCLVTFRTVVDALHIIASESN